MIAMFDSGLGGLSVWKAVRAALPGRGITYLADQAYCPYGQRSHSDIAERSVRMGRYLQEQGATLLVVACNTATTAGIAAMRRELSIPLVGIEPAIKPAAAMSRTGRIAVLATQATLQSERVRKLLDTHAGHVEVLRRVGTGWVEQVEAGELDSPRTRELVAAVVRPLLDERIDHIALGCTHYPFLEPLIRELTGDGIALYDPAEAIARRVASLLPDAAPAVAPAYRFITTDADSAGMRRILPLLIGADHPVESLPLEQAQ
ncbi:MULTISPECIES: glutamate racemase [Chromobacterium]|uniref:glutamate racemase n=1 Tax=Chromobacterium TaxID=535 RepID=UPI001D06FD46|nr:MULTISPECIES: glutamate racemase [Chromobacterium]MCP1291378.1 glutamate racemase [Chromobacterium sp. S0633]